MKASLWCRGHWNSHFCFCCRNHWLVAEMPLKLIWPKTTPASSHLSLISRWLLQGWIKTVLAVAVGTDTFRGNYLCKIFWFPQIKLDNQVPYFRNLSLFLSLKVSGMTVSFSNNDITCERRRWSAIKTNSLELPLLCTHQQLNRSP